METVTILYKGVCVYVELATNMSGCGKYSDTSTHTYKSKCPLSHGIEEKWVMKKKRKVDDRIQ